MRELIVFTQIRNCTREIVHRSNEFTTLIDRCRPLATVGSIIKRRERSNPPFLLHSDIVWRALTVYIFGEEFWRSGKRDGDWEIGGHGFDSAFNARSTASMLLRIITHTYTYIRAYLLYTHYFIIDREAWGERANNPRHLFPCLSFSCVCVTQTIHYAGFTPALINICPFSEAFPAGYWSTIICLTEYFIGMSIRKL